MASDATRALAVVLAGGEGRRLRPLTAQRAKPAVPFGGAYRLVDFVLSNLVNAGFVKIVVLTQGRSQSLEEHIAETWHLSTMLRQYVRAVTPETGPTAGQFTGSGDAIHQNLDIIREERPDHVLVFGADHVYRMDPRQMLEQHVESGAGVTVAATRVPASEASAFGVFDADDSMRITRFTEKPEKPAGLPGSPHEVLASMGNYVFSRQALARAVRVDARDSSSGHDIGGDIIPRLVEEGEADVYDFACNEVPGVRAEEQGYWRDVGTIDSFYDAHMDLLSVHPAFDLDNSRWPIHSRHTEAPPARLVGDRGACRAVDCIVAPGAVVGGAKLTRSVLSPHVEVNHGAVVEGSILMDCVTVGEGAHIRNAIVDEGVTIPPGTTIVAGTGPADDPFPVSDNGVVVVPASEKVVSA